MNPSRRVVIHVGQTKAGSTSLQNYLETQRDALLARGVLFPASGLSRKNPFDSTRTSGHLQLFLDLHGGDGAAFGRELAACPHHTLVLSAENLFSDQPDAVLEAAGRHFSQDEVEVWAVLRPQFDWLRSRYVENVLSGFSAGTETFARFVEIGMERGILDYGARLRHVAGLLGARRIRAVPFLSEDPSADGALVPRFLEAAGIPVTDPGAAAGQHSNIREKSPVLVEAKRRLNILCAGLPLSERLEMEHDLRRHHAGSPGVPDDPEFRPGIPLGDAALAVLQRSNRTLADAGIMATPLDSGQSGTDAVADPEAVAGLVRRGMELATGICARSEDRARLRGCLPRFSFGEYEAMAAALEGGAVSTHLLAPETALLAAMAERRLVRLYLAPSRATWRLSARLDGLMSPSPVVARLTSAIGKEVEPPPQIVVAGAGTGAAMLAPLLKLPSVRRAILLEGARDLVQDLPLSGLFLRNVGRCLFLAKTPEELPKAAVPT